MITIREAAPDDYPIIQHIAHRTWPNTFGAILNPAQIDYMLGWMYSLPALEEQVNEKGHQFLMAQEGDEHLGYLSYEVNYKGTTKTKIHKIYILPSAQGKGVGKALFAQATAAALAQENNALSLNVNRQNSAVQFYERLGFAVVAEENIDIGNGFWMEDFVMERPIA